MERLIEFLLSNFYYVIIVIGLVYTMFFRKSPLERPPENRPAPRPQNPQQRPTARPSDRMPDFGGAPMFPPKPRPAPAQPVERKGPPPVERRAPEVERQGPAPVDRREPRPDIAIPSQPVYRSPDPIREPSPGRSSDSADFPPIERAPASTAPSAAISAAALEDSAPRLSRDDLTRAIVWAEILGPPRARRPYGRS